MRLLLSCFSRVTWFSSWGSLGSRGPVIWPQTHGGQGGHRETLPSPRKQTGSSAKSVSHTAALH